MVRSPLLLEVVDVRHYQPDRDPEEVVDPAHPFGMKSGEIVVHGDEVHAATGERVQVDGKRRDERLSLTGLHLGDPTKVKRHSAHQLDVEVALADGADGSLTDDRESLYEQVVQVFTVLEAGAELDGLAGQLGVAQDLDLGLDAVDEGDDRLQAAHLPALAGAQHLREDAHDVPV